MATLSSECDVFVWIVHTFYAEFQFSRLSHRNPTPDLSQIRQMFVSQSGRLHFS